MFYKKAPFRWQQPRFRTKKKIARGQTLMILGIVPNTFTVNKRAFFWGVRFCRGFSYWSRWGELVFTVTLQTSSMPLDMALLSCYQRCAQLSAEWSGVMSTGKNPQIRTQLWVYHRIFLDNIALFEDKFEELLPSDLWQTKGAFFPTCSELPYNLLFQHPLNETLFLKHETEKTLGILRQQVSLSPLR